MKCAIGENRLCGNVEKNPEKKILKSSITENIHLMLIFEALINT